MIDMCLKVMYIRIGNLRKMNGYSVDYVCKKIGCCRPQLYNLENGRYNPYNVTYKFIEGLCELYDVDVDFIVGMMVDDNADYIDSCTSDPVQEDQCCMFE